ncbi:MAG: MFS transporter [Pseudomonadales bacterium]|nr:MFS transporter [Pseudomonadales bacterium]
MMTDKEEMQQGWPMLVVAFLLIFFAFGVPTYSLPWMYGPAMAEFGWSNAEVNLLSTAKFLVGAAAALGMGIMVDKIGGKTAVLIGALSGGLALLLFLFATTLPVYYLAGGILGLSASSIVAAMKVVISRLFTINQGLAIGIVLTATSTGGIVMPLIWQPLLETMNWRSIAALMSLGTFLIATPLWLVFMSRTGNLQTTVNAGKIVEKGDTGLWKHFREISQDKGFWLIAVGIFVVSAVDQAMMQNYVNFLSADKGIIMRDIKWAGSFLAVMGVVAKVGSGWIYDRFSIPGIRFFYFLLAVSVFLALPVAGMFTLFLFISVRGIAHGGLIVDAPILTKHYLGSKNLGMTIGVMSVCINLGYAAGPPLLGMFVDRNGDFTVGLIVYACAALVGTLLLMPIKPRYWIPPAERKKQEDATTAGMRPATAQ